MTSSNSKSSHVIVITNGFTYQAVVEGKRKAAKKVACPSYDKHVLSKDRQQLKMIDPMTEY